ncbi:MAG: helix-turn-helix domain-containing protein [Ilumatobacteraceae bacterium]
MAQEMVHVLDQAAAGRAGDGAADAGTASIRDRASPLDVETLARGEHVSAGHLSRCFKQAYGESPYSYLMTRRIERAMALLRSTDLGD